jgi:hypothetical protein
MNSKKFFGDIPVSEYITGIYHLKEIKLLNSVEIY